MTSLNFSLPYMTHNVLEYYSIKSNQHEMSAHLQTVANFIAKIREMYYGIIR